MKPNSENEQQSDNNMKMNSRATIICQILKMSSRATII